MLQAWREWGIAALGVCVIVGGLYLASLPGGGSATQQNTPAPQNERAAQSSQSAPTAQKPPPAPSSSKPQSPLSANVAPAAPPPSKSRPTQSAAASPATPAAPQSTVAAAPASGSLPIAGGDPASGRQVFKQCQVCHSLDPGRDILGPSLAGIVGRKSGSQPGYAYSPAMKQAHLVWDAKTLDAYLTDPQKVVPGNKMPFPGLKTAQDRSDLIDFLAGAPQAAPAAAAAAQAQPSAANKPPQALASQPAVAAAPGSGSLPVAGGDPASGRQVFKKCQVCHSLDPGRDILGPSLAGIVGRKSGSEPGYAYSPAMKQANLVWDAKTLDAYLTDPQKLVPGNKMPFPGLKTAQDRSDVIDFLASAGAPKAAPAAAAQAQPSAANKPPQAPAPLPEGSYLPDAKYTLRSGIADGRMVYIGVGGEIDGKVNPVLTASQGQVVELTLINGEGAEHDITFPDQNARSPRVTGKGASTTIAFRAEKAGDYLYYCSVPGHRLAGMQGQFIVTPRAPAQTVVEADISREPDDLPPPITRRDPMTVHVDLLAAEVEGRLAAGTTFGYWTFNGKVPGPFIRVRVGDTVDLHLKNSADSAMMHSVDLHAVTGPGGGAAVLSVAPGEEKSMTWKALVPGLFVYHCATPMVSEHIANGMYGLILVEPAQGLPHADREFYIMQGEVYTDMRYGQQGSAEFSVEKLLDEQPEYFVFNGSVGALSKLHPLHAKVGDTVRIFFGVGGPNFTSSFHVIGEIFDKVYLLGGLSSPPLEGIQTVSVAPGGAVIVEFKTKVPGNYTVVDHALARAERGLSGILTVEGPPNPDIFNGQPMPGMGH